MTVMVVSESYSCLLRLKSLTEDDAVRMQAGSGETHLLYVYLFHVAELGSTLNVG